MTLKSFVQVTMLTSLFSVPALAATEDNNLKGSFRIESQNETVVAIKKDITPLEEKDKQFNFDWNNYTTIAANKNNIGQVEIFIAQINDVSKLSKPEQKALASLLYKLGTYYTHVARDSNSSITKLTTATPFLNSKEEKAWNANQLAYAYEQRYSSSKLAADKEKSLFYANKVLTQLYPNEKNSITAFANCIKGLLEGDDKNYAAAEKYFQTALAIYDLSPKKHDNQYARIQNRLANAMLDQARNEEAIALLKQVKKYWSQQGHLSQSPYAARNMLSLGHAYLKTNNPKAACEEYKTAVAIYKNIYGSKSTLLVKPYQALAESYRKIGSLEHASAFDKKAKDLAKA